MIDPVLGIGRVCGDRAVGSAQGVPIIVGALA